MSWVLAITNQKGGVGKTTTAINLAAALQAFGRRVLLVDMDPQGNATVSAGYDKQSIERHIGQVLLEEVGVTEALLTTDPGGFDLLPATIDLAGAEFQLVTRIGRETKLRQALAPLTGDYDFVLIDCPPALNTLTINSLAAADDVLIPVQCEYFALEGLSALLDTIEQVRVALNPDLGIAGVLRTLYDARNRLAQDVSAQLRQHFGDRVFNALVPRNVRLAEAPSHGLPAMFYDKSSTGAEAHADVARELIKRARKRGKLGKSVTLRKGGNRGAGRG
ncbi:MAG: ParA family protein [Guyparkeria sp.]